MNKKGTQATQSGVILSIVIAFVVLFIGGIMMYSNIKGDLNAASTSANDRINAQFNAINTKVDSATGKIDAAVTELQSTAASIPTTVTINTDDLDNSGICNNINGCGGRWDVDSEDDIGSPNDYTNRVINELTESTFRDLYKEIRGQINVDDNSDIQDAWTTQTGDVKTNQDPDRGFTETRTVTVNMVIAVEFYEDGDNDDTKTKYFKVTALVDELENGVWDSDVEYMSVSKVSSNYVLP